MTSKSTALWIAGVCAFVAGATGGGGGEAGAKADPRRSRAEVIELGRRLFMDPTVSRLGRNSCASCHDPERAFSDTRPRSPDDTGDTKRHSQTLLDLAGEGFHWDGEFRTVRQLLVARVAPAEMANDQMAKLAAERVAAAKQAGIASAAATTSPVPGTTSAPPAPTSAYGEVTPSEVPLTPVAARLAEDGRYAAAFQAAYGSPIVTLERVLDAMDAYCASLKSSTNAFDRFLAGDDHALSASALRGLALFEGRAGCAQCHVTRPSGGRATLSDGKFHDTGVAFRADPRWRAGLDGGRPQDAGRGGVTLMPGDEGRFKTPSLRDVAVRAPYMHDASFGTLADVVRYYAGGGTRHPGLDGSIAKFDATDEDVADVVAFLGSLTSDTRPGLGMPPAERKPLRVKVEDLAGRPMPALTVRVAASGDRLAGGQQRETETTLLTDDDGCLVIDRPFATHVALRSDAFELGLSRPIPDSCVSQTLIATPMDTISLRVRRAPDGPALPRSISVFEGETIRVMGGCGSTPATTLTRVRTLGGSEALYAGKAKALGARRRCALLLDGATALLADVELGGGASETIVLERQDPHSFPQPPRRPPGTPPADDSPSRGEPRHADDPSTGPRTGTDR
jgi:cytochrome c peroxidase